MTVSRTAARLIVVVFLVWFLNTWFHEYIKSCLFIYLWSILSRKINLAFIKKLWLLDFGRNIFTSVNYCATCQQKVMASINSYKFLHPDHHIPGVVMSPVLKRVTVLNIMIELFVRFYLKFYWIYKKKKLNEYDNIYTSYLPLICLEFTCFNIYICRNMI